MTNLITDEQIRRTIDTATEKTVAALSGEDSRNDVNNAHIALLRGMAEEMAETVLERREGFFTLAADTGLGKSTAACAFAAAMLEHVPAETGIGMLILHSQIAEGADGIKRIIGMAHDPDAVRREVCHVHTERRRRARTAPEKAGDFRVVVSTHARSYTAKMGHLLEWHGQMRGNLIDEGLHKADTFGMEHRYLDGAAAWVHAHMKTGTLAESRTLEKWMEELVEKIEAARASLLGGADGRDAFALFDHRAPLNSDQLIYLLKQKKTGKADVVLDGIIGLLRHSNVSPEFRVVKSGVIQARRAFPERMTSGLIMDAGSDIDRRFLIDEEVADVRVADKVRWSAVRMTKNWNNVDMYCMHTSTARDALDKAANSQEDEGDWIFYAFADKIAEVYAAHPEWELLVCTLEAREEDHAKEMQLVLEDEHGIDARDRRINWITYGGEHKGSNKYRNARAIFDVGSWNIKPITARALHLGAVAADSSTPEPTKAEVGKIMASHCGTAKVQLIGRGNGRHVVGMVTAPMDYYYATVSSNVRRIVEVKHGKGKNWGAGFHDWPLPPAGLRERQQRSRQSAPVKTLTERIVSELGSTGKTQIYISGLYASLGLPKSLGETKKARKTEVQRRGRAVVAAVKASRGWIKEGSGPDTRLVKYPT